MKSEEDRTKNTREDDKKGENITYDENITQYNIGKKMGENYEDKSTDYIEVLKLGKLSSKSDLNKTEKNVMKEIG